MADARCPRCTQPLVSISITISGQARTMCSCSRCGFRRWYSGDRPGEPVPLAGVLAEIRDERRATRLR